MAIYETRTEWEAAQQGWIVALDVDFTLESGFDFYNFGVPGATTAKKVTLIGMRAGRLAL